MKLPEFILDYTRKHCVKTKEWIGRAGAYSIEDKASLFIKKIIGSPSNVVGLPMEKLFKILKNEFGVNLLQLAKRFK